jgi:hypothetical protein
MLRRGRCFLSDMPCHITQFRGCPPLLPFIPQGLTAYLCHQTNEDQIERFLEDDYHFRDPSTSKRAAYIRKDSFFRRVWSVTRNLLPAGPSPPGMNL